MPERSSITQTVQIGKEATEGTAVAALTRLASLSIETGINLNFSKFRAAGKRYPQLVTPGKRWTGLTGSGKLTYTEILYLFASVLEDVTPTTPGGGTLAREWLFEQSTTTEETTATYTIQQGSGVRAHQAAGGFLSGFTVQGDPDAVDISSLEGFARALTDGVQMSTNEVQTLTAAGPPTSGTFQLTFSGQQTATIAFNATAGAIQTALEALSNIAVGDVVCTGGPINTTPVLVEFRGAYRQTDVALMTSVDTFDVGDCVVTASTPGVAPSEIALVPVLPHHVSIYADDTSGTLGTTLLTRVLNWSLPMTNHRGPFFTVNAANSGSMAGKVDLEPGARFTMLIEADAAGMAFYTTAQTGATKFVRIIATGDLIEAGQAYEIRMDLAVKIDSLGAFTDDQGLYAYEVGFQIVHDGGWGKSHSIRVRNAITTL